MSGLMTRGQGWLMTEEYGREKVTYFFRWRCWLEKCRAKAEKVLMVTRVEVEIQNSHHYLHCKLVICLSRQKALRR